MYECTYMLHNYAMHIAHSIILVFKISKHIVCLNIELL